PEGVNLTRFASITYRFGDTGTFEGTLKTGDLEQIQKIALPAKNVEVIVLPLLTLTPDATPWADLFRFDPEI
ncbi:MAG TPA: hypothetical protein PKC28_14190, partial [Bdellovibrionales bacterium]|nr:hypothetical protein [Bdellovibrionales bacterium]